MIRYLTLKKKSDYDSAMVKSFLVMVLTIVVLFTASNTFAQNFSPSTEFNPNAVFWPLSAGKTVDDSLYFLKQWKETLRGLIIFGQIQKADYQLTLTTKRLLEADKLMQEKKTDAALKTLDLARLQIDSILTNVEKVKKNEIKTETKLSMIDRLNKLREYEKKLQGSTDDQTKQKLDGLDTLEEKILNILY